MREILFRGMTCGGEWVEGSLHIEYGETTKDGEGKTDYRILGMRGECTYIIHETIGQFTGLTDKNGKKIFEGDIVIARQRGNKFDISTIGYENGAFMVYPNNAKIYERTVWEYWYNDWSLEVIGNIHDNPELLKEGADND